MKNDILKFLRYKDSNIIGVVGIEDYDSEHYIIEYLYKNDDSEEEKLKCRIIKEDLIAFTKGIKAKIEWM